MAIGTLSYNIGATRKAIWKFFMQFYEKQVDYNTFLLAISQLQEEGKLEKNENGYFWI